MRTPRWQVVAICVLGVVALIIIAPFASHFVRGLRCRQEAVRALRAASGVDLYAKLDCSYDFFGSLCEIACRTQGGDENLWVYRQRPSPELCALSPNTPFFEQVPCCEGLGCGRYGK